MLVTRLIFKIVTEIASEIDDAESEIQLAVEQTADLYGDGWTELALEIGCVSGPLSDSHTELAELVGKLANTILKAARPLLTVANSSPTKATI